MFSFTHDTMIPTFRRPLLSTCRFHFVFVLDVVVRLRMNEPWNCLVVPTPGLSGNQGATG
jgi:hypothetical protein